MAAAPGSRDTWSDDDDMDERKDDDGGPETIPELEEGIERLKRRVASGEPRDVLTGATPQELLDSAETRLRSARGEMKGRRRARDPHPTGPFAPGASEQVLNNEIAELSGEITVLRRQYEAGDKSVGPKLTEAKDRLWDLHDMRSSRRRTRERGIAHRDDQWHHQKAYDDRMDARLARQREAVENLKFRKGAGESVDHELMMAEAILKDETGYRKALGGVFEERRSEVGGWAPISKLQREYFADLKEKNKATKAKAKEKRYWDRLDATSFAMEGGGGGPVIEPPMGIEQMRTAYSGLEVKWYTLIAKYDALTGGDDTKPLPIEQNNERLRLIIQLGATCSAMKDLAIPLNVNTTSGQPGKPPRSPWNVVFSNVL